MSIKYVAVGPMKGKTFKIPGPLTVVDGVVDVPEGLHEKYGRVLMEDWGVCPARLVQEESADPETPLVPEPEDPPHREEVITGDTAQVKVQIPIEQQSGKGRRK